MTKSQITMTKENNIGKIIGLAMLLFAIGFNLWLYRLEPTAMVDPNDNAFQFALVDRTNQIWDFAHKKCTEKFGAWNLALGAFCQVSYLADHWVPNWAEGYNLPFYYSHVPQILIVGSWRLLIGLIGRIGQIGSISLFQYYHWVIYFLLSLFPLSIFLALLALRSSWLLAGIGALLAGHLSTDGLYGLDPPSFLWRGYGLSSQLFGMIWMPMAIAYSYRFFTTVSAEGEVKQFLRELAFRLKILQGNLLQTKRHLARYENRVYDLSDDNRASRKNSFAESFIPAVFFITATAMGHLGLGIMAMLSLVPLALARPIMMMLHQESPSHIYEATKNHLTKLLFLAGTIIFFLSYWVVPIFLTDNYHNISFWDPPWKFASYGAKEIMTRLFNGDLFDWGRGPWMTALVIMGLVGAAWPRKQVSRNEYLGFRENQRSNSYILDTNPSLHNNPYFPFALLFLFWLLMYFGRTTWGPLIDLIPGMKEFHLSRFIVGLHVAGLFLMPMGIQTIVSGVMYQVSRIQQYNSKFIPLFFYSLIRLFAYFIIGLFILPPIYKQTIEYSRHNDRLIKQSNENYEKVKEDEQALFAALRDQFTRSSLGEGGPGRVFAGRGGGFGKDFQVSETPYYMHLSTYGIPTTLWLPETWSPNSDVEQYFSEDKARDYDLFGIRYVAAPPAQKSQPFWRLIDERKTWKLYEIYLTGDAEGGIPRDAQPSNLESSLMDKIDRNTSIAREGNRGTRQKTVSYFTTGVRPAIVATDKRSYGNVVRLWIQSDSSMKGLYPELTFANDYPKATGLPNFKMLDEVTYMIPDGSKHNLFQEPPVYLPPGIQSIEQFNNTTIQQYNNIKIENEKNDGDMIFKAKISVQDNCQECIVVLKQSFHPNWRATIDGEPAQPFTVFPFYLATLIPAGQHEVVFSYEPSRLKVILLSLEILVLGGIIAASLRNIYFRQ